MISPEILHMAEAQAYGEAAFPGGIDELAAALGAAGVACEVRESSHYAGGRYVRLAAEGFDAMFERLDDGDYLIHCEADTLDSARAAVADLSRAMASRGLRHRFELYDGDQLVDYFHQDWPA